jgi:hypothetical protein
MKKWNMFQFGEVVVPNHPAIPVVPMALQMVYLYPLGRGEGGEVRYRMLVPMHHHQAAGAVSPPPLFTGTAALSPSPPAAAGGGGGLLHINLPQYPTGGAVPTVGRPGSAAAASEPELEPGPSVKRPADGGDGTKSSPPLDLTNKSPDKEEVNKQQQQQQRFLESQINLIKIKELELLKNAAASAAAVAAAAAANTVSPVNNHRCNDCNINFTKPQNYLAHKKYYCSGVKQQQQLQQLDSDDPEAAAAAAGSLEPPAQLLRPPPPKCKSPRVAQERMAARELLLKQQQQQEALQSSLLAVGIKTTSSAVMPLLLPNPR